MPRKVDADERRRHVVEALFRVAVRDGLARASLRTVADEAGLNIGSLRHYFASQSDLMRFAMRAMLEQVGERVRHGLADLAGQRDAPAAQRIRTAGKLLGELLPLDDVRRAEVTVFLDFAALARTRPDLHDLADEAARGSRTAVRRILAYVTGLSPRARALDVETERLLSLLDGLGINAVLHPDLVTADDAVRVVDAHLRALAR